MIGRAVLLGSQGRSIGRQRPVLDITVVNVHFGFQDVNNNHGFFRENALQAVFLCGILTG